MIDSHNQKQKNETLNDDNVRDKKKDEPIYQNLLESHNHDNSNSCNNQISYLDESSTKSIADDKRLTKLQELQVKLSLTRECGRLLGL